MLESGLAVGRGMEEGTVMLGGADPEFGGGVGSSIWAWRREVKNAVLDTAPRMSFFPDVRALW